MIRFWLLALRNLGRNQKRNLATGSAIAFGFAGILLLAAYAYRATNYLRVYTVYVVHTGHLVIFPEHGFEKFPFQPELFSFSAEDQARIRSVLEGDPETERFERQIRGQGLMGNGCLSLPFVAQGYEPEVDRALREHPQVKEWMPKFKSLLDGRGLWNFPADSGSLLLSRGLSLALGKTKMHDSFPANPIVSLPDCTHPKEQASRDANVQLLSGAWRGNISAVDGEVVGLFTTGFQESDNSGIVTSVNLLQKLFDTDRVAQVALWLKHPEKIAEVSERLEEKFRAAGLPVELLRWDEERLSPYYRGTADFLGTIVLAGAIVLSLIIALSVLNSVTMTILERSQEIGMYRSMGFRRSHLQVLYVQESVLLSAISLAIGSGLGLLAIRLINAANIIYHPPGVAGGITLTLILPWSSIFQASGFILLLVITATILAVSSRLRSRPADLLGGTLR